MREMPQWVMHHYFSLVPSLFQSRHTADIFMAAICDFAMGRLADCRYFLGIVHDWINTGFMRNAAASSYIQMVFIVCCFLSTNSSKQRKDKRYRWCLQSVYHDSVTSSQQKLKNFFFSHQLGKSHFTLFLILVWHESHFFGGGWRDVLQWCNVRAHKIIICAFDLPQHTSPHWCSNVWPLCAVSVLFFYKRESTGVSSGMRDITLATHIFVPTRLSVCMQSFVTKLGTVVECHAKRQTGRSVGYHCGKYDGFFY